MRSGSVVDMTPGAGADGRIVLEGRYQLEGLLGRGGMADVYRAEDLTLERPVAVKVLRDTAGDEGNRARFIREARTLAQLSHSGLVTLLDAGFGSAAGPGALPFSDDVQPFLVLELVDGPSLARVVADGALAMERVGSIGIQVAEALDYVHGRGVVHRDVTPGNVLLRRQDDRVKLADFGIARLLEDTARHTRTGEAIGTAAYLSPEQVTGGEVDGAADIYSLGLVLLEALTGERQYVGGAAEAAFARLTRAPSVPAHLPEVWRRLLSAMTAVEPASRPCARQVADILRGQPTGPVPLASVREPDAVTVPLLAREAAAEHGGTRVLTAAQAVAAPGPPLPATGRGEGSGGQPLMDRLGDRVARGVRGLARGAASSSTEARAIAAVLGVLVVLVLVAGIVAARDPAGSDIPANTPAELRAPLMQLHRAVDGESG